MTVRPWLAYLVVFVASACTLVLEIVAGRVLAPFIGVSIYTWTSIIGVVLAGIALGNYAGGFLADRAGSRRMLGIILVAGGLATLAVLPVLAAGPDTLLPRGYPVVLRIVLLTALLFLPPSVVLGMVSPVVVKMTLADLGRTGNVVGRVYAWSAVGSIAGTFLTGFVLIAHLGTRAVILGVGLTLVALGAAAGDFVRRAGRGRAVGAVLAVLLAVALWQIHGRGALAGWCDRESAYYCIRVEEEPGVEGRSVRRLVLDHLIHGYVDPDDPTYLHYPYLRTYAELAAYVAQRAPAPRALFIGGGPYTLPRLMAARYPGAVLEVAEIDPAVTAVAHERLGLPRATRILTHNADAREVVEAKQGGAPYDLVVGDAFNDLTVPYHLTTREFARRVRRILTDDGLYLALIIDRMAGGRFLASFVWTLQTEFPHVHVVAEPAQVTQSLPQTYVVVAGARPLDPARLSSVRGEGPGEARETRLLPPDMLAAWLRTARPVLLTDDHAPVDNLLAPIFLDRGF